MTTPTLKLYLKLPYDPNGTGNPENFEDGTFEYEATSADADKFMESMEPIWFVDGEGMIKWINEGKTALSDPQSNAKKKFIAYLESDPSRFRIDGDKCYRDGGE